jgi:hypothetical protein
MRGRTIVSTYSRCEPSISLLPKVFSFRHFCFYHPVLIRSCGHGEDGDVRGVKSYRGSLERVYQRFKTYIEVRKWRCSR